MLDTHTLADTPHKQHKAWLYDIPPGATAGEAAELRRANGQSCRNARRKAKDEEISDKAALEPLSVRAERASIGQGGPLFGPERRKAQKALSQKVRQAELSVAEQYALNERRRDQRAAESVDTRDALNERRRANEQVTISVRLAVRSRPHNPN